MKPLAVDSFASLWQPVLCMRASKFHSVYILPLLTVLLMIDSISLKPLCCMICQILGSY